MQPNYLLIGATRCGTTWLGKNLMLHPQVFMPSQKEIHFFNRHYDKGIDWYFDIFEHATEKAIGEATPGYLYHEHIPELIRKDCPDVKLIVCLRDPVERAYSHYWYREDERRAQNIVTTFEDKIQQTPRLIEEGLYARKLKKYLELFDKDKLLILFNDDLKRDPEGYLKKVFEFLEVDTEFKSPLLNKKLNVSASKIGRARILYYLQKALNKLGIYSLAKAVDSMNRKEIPPINPSTRKMLIEKFYLDDINELEKISGKDLSTWKI